MHPVYVINRSVYVTNFSARTLKVQQFCSNLCSDFQKIIIIIIII